MKSTAKAQAQVRVLKERLDFRLSGSSTINTSRQANDVDGWPMLFLSVGGTEAATNPVIAIRIKAENAISKDVFGGDLIAFTPHDLELAYELKSGGAQPAASDLVKVMAEIGKIGMKILVKEIVAATAVTEASMNAAAVAVALESEVTWPTKGM